jgi:5-dehydro-2-deoxygluconokinase
MSGWVRGEDYDACSRYANVRRAGRLAHGCAGMPTRVELVTTWPTRTVPRPDRDVDFTRLHWVSAHAARRAVHFAFDHRDPFYDLAREVGAAESRLPALKKLLVRAVGETESARGLQGRVGLLCDDRYGQDALNAATGRGWWVGRPVELPARIRWCSSTRSVGTTLIAWPVEQVVMPGRVPSGRRHRDPAGERGAVAHTLRRRAGQRP